jgi:hypothetical protein
MSERRGNPRLTLAKDEGRLRSLAELLLDELGSDGPQLDVHKSSAALDRIADRPDTRGSSRLSHKPAR